jgi:hypothetical protein
MLRTAVLSRSFHPFPQLQSLEAKGRRKAFPAAISPASPVSGGQSGVGDGAGPGNRRAGVYRIDSFYPSPRWCLPSVVGGAARFHRGGGGPLRHGVPGGVGEAMATAAQRNKVSRLLPRPGAALLQLDRRGRGRSVSELEAGEFPFSA